MTIPTDGIFKVFGSNDLLGGDPWLLLPAVEPLTWRRQERGLGSATFRLLDHQQPLTQPPNDWGVISGGLWVVVVDTSKLQDPSATSIPELTDLSGGALEWWGFFRTAPLVQAQNGGIDGLIEASEFGYFLMGEPITHPQHIAGYNPRIEGTVYGNRLADAVTSDRDQVNSFWTNKQVAEDLAGKVGISMEIDWLAEPPLLEDVESWPSYEGESLMTALEQVIGPMGWYFDPTVSSGSIAIKAYPRSSYADMDTEYARTLATDGRTIELEVVEHERPYDRIILRGQRVLLTFTASTYGGEPTLTRGWTAAEQAQFLTGPEGAIANKDLAQKVGDDLGDFDPDEWENEDDYRTTLGEETQRLLQAEFERNRAWRERNLPDVYQRFLWNYDENPLTRRLMLSVVPGRELPPIQPAGSGTVLTGTPARRFPAFPLWQIQDPTTQEVYETPLVEADTDAQPGITDWEPHDHLTVPIKDDEGRIIDWHRPFFALRTIGNLSTAEWNGGQKIRKQEWLDLTIPSSGTQTGEMRHDGWGIELSLPWPESLAAPYRDPWIDLVQVSNDVGDITYAGFYGLNDQEWEDDTAAASSRNPAEVEYLDKGHWGRMIFTISVRTSQWVQLEHQFVDEPVRTKIVEDPELELWAYARGTVVRFLEWDKLTSLRQGSGTNPQPLFADGVTTTPDYLNIQDEFAGDSPDWYISRNTIPDAADRLEMLKDWFGKARRAVELRIPVFSDPQVWATGTPTEPQDWQIGQLVDEVEDTPGGRQPLVVDTAVAAIEVQLNADRPIRTIITEIPQAPPNSRFRRLID